ncbi:MAG: hypothetical protein JJ976_10425 [Rhodothermales bacterium]|nr:hypothetical protein [Rhodothermales bacterium]
MLKGLQLRADTPLRPRISVAHFRPLRIEMWASPAEAANRSIAPQDLTGGFSPGSSFSAKF